MRAAVAMSPDERLLVIGPLIIFSSVTFVFLPRLKDIADDATSDVTRWLCRRIAGLAPVLIWLNIVLALFFVWNNWRELLYVAIALVTLLVMGYFLCVTSFAAEKLKLLRYLAYSQKYDQISNF